jgi:hypothetical protein
VTDDETTSADSSAAAALPVALADYHVAYFDLPEYNEAFRSYMDSAMHGLSALKDPILGQMSRARFRRTYRGRNSVDPVAATACERRGGSARVSLQRRTVNFGGSLDRSSRSLLVTMAMGLFPSLCRLVVARHAPVTGELSLQVSLSGRPSLAVRTCRVRRSMGPPPPGFGAVGAAARDVYPRPPSGRAVSAS